MAGPRRPPALISRKGVDEQLAQAKKLIQGITSQTAIMRNMGVSLGGVTGGVVASRSTQTRGPLQKSCSSHNYPRS